MKRSLCGCVTGCLLLAEPAGMAGPPQTDEELRRDTAIAEYSEKMREANYPVLFDKAAQEFGVPADVLKGVAFAETRWEQLTWPSGEIASPETGMPRPYDIMSLWNNPLFGHSLIEAATLLGESPEVLKQDAYQNIRGGAALLRKIYDETPKPAGTTEADIESWRYAIRKYCGIPEPDLNAQHALDVYVFMSQGYHQYGIEWNARQVNLEPIREETREIVTQERAKREALWTASHPDAQPATNLTAKSPYPAATSGSNAAIAFATRDPMDARALRWIILCAFATLIVGLMVRRRRINGPK